MDFILLNIIEAISNEVQICIDYYFRETDDFVKFCVILKERKNSFLI